MKITPDCVVCTAQQAMHAVALSSDEDDWLEYASLALRQLADYLHPDISPAYLGTLMHRYIQQITGVTDPYRELKRRSNIAARSLLRQLPLNGMDIRRAVTLAVVGNAIDFGVSHKLEAMLEGLLEQGLAIDDVAELEAALDETGEVLYLLDNAGEVIFDGLLIKAIKEQGVRVVAVAKSAPVLNDITVDEFAALDLAADEVIGTGSGIMGIVESEVSDDLLARLHAAKLVIAKGMGHYETVPELRLPGAVAYLLKAKCKPVAQDLGVAMGDNVALVMNGLTQRQDH